MVLPGVLTTGSVRFQPVCGPLAFEHDLNRGRHLDIEGLALHYWERLAHQAAGYILLVQPTFRR